MHVFIFEALAAHANSAAVKRLEAAYCPELVDGDVVFTDDYSWHQSYCRAAASSKIEQHRDQRMRRWSPASCIASVLRLRRVGRALTGHHEGTDSGILALLAEH